MAREPFFEKRGRSSALERGVTEVGNARLVLRISLVSVNIEV